MQIHNGRVLDYNPAKGKQPSHLIKVKCLEKPRPYFFAAKLEKMRAVQFLSLFNRMDPD